MERETFVQFPAHPKHGGNAARNEDNDSLMCTPQITSCLDFPKPYAPDNPVFPVPPDTHPKLIDQYDSAIALHFASKASVDTESAFL